MAANLTQEQLDEIRRRLESRAAELREDVDSERSETTRFKDIAGDVGDPGDASFADHTIDERHAAINRDMEELYDIRAALQRIEDDTYGQCEHCGRDIQYERLLVQPIAIRCTPCQEQYEKTHAGANTRVSL